MMTIEQLRKQVRLRLESKGGLFRFTHILGVEEVAVQIALRHQLSERFARQAALIHDATKYDSETEHIERITRSFGASELSNWPKPLWHCLSAVDYAKHDCGISHPEVLSAIQYHGSARPAMTPLEQVIYIADYAEPTRPFKNDHIRDLAMHDLNAALLQSIQEIVTHEAARGHQPLAITKAAIAYYQDSKEEPHE
jgi:predicted HD superfamily hydrolase involved in NAD metabolism